MTPLINIFVLTVGEPITIETIKRLKKNTKYEFTLTVWYHPFEFNQDFFNKLQLETDDVIYCTKNQGTVSPGIFAQLCKNFDYQVSSTADCLVKENYIEKLIKPFNDKKVGMTGLTLQPLVKEPSDIVTPDNLFMVSKEMINDIGAICPAFSRYGEEKFEFFKRIKERGWKIISVPYIGEHDNMRSEGRDQMPDWKQELDKSCRLWLKIQRENPVYNWWTNKI